MSAKAQMLSATLTLLVVSTCYAQVVSSPLAPTDKKECEASWQENIKRAKELRLSVSSCHEQCTNRYVAASWQYRDSICGGSIPNAQVHLDGLYRECTPIKRKHDEYWVQIKEAHQSCLGAIDRNVAAKTVWQHSNSNKSFDEPLSSTRKVTTELRSRTTTGSRPTDYLRDQSSERAERAVNSIMKDSLQEIESAGNSTKRPGNKAERCRELSGIERKKCLAGKP